LDQRGLPQRPPRLSARTSLDLLECLCAMAAHPGPAPEFLSGAQKFATARLNRGGFLGVESAAPPTQFTPGRSRCRRMTTDAQDGNAHGHPPPTATGSIIDCYLVCLPPPARVPSCRRSLVDSRKSGCQIPPYVQGTSTRRLAWQGFSMAMPPDGLNVRLATCLFPATDGPRKWRQNCFSSRFDPRQ